MRRLRYRFLGRCPYRPILALQNRLADQLKASPEADEWILAVEHEPVITIGRRGSKEHVLASQLQLDRLGVEVVDVERGGEVTYHGPGQLVLYPIVRVSPRRFGVRELVQSLAGAITDELHQLGINARYDSVSPGLWVEKAKIGAVGMRVARGVSTHGAAINVTVDLDAFQMIVPCGVAGAAVTSVAELVGTEPELSGLAERICQRFCERVAFVLVR